jgi:hypothetical protein
MPNILDIHSSFNTPVFSLLDLVAWYRLIGALSEAEARQVVQELGQTYDRLVVLEHELDVLTYHNRELERVQRWKKEKGEVEDGCRRAA